MSAVNVTSVTRRVVQFWPFTTDKIEYKWPKKDKKWTNSKLGNGRFCQWFKNFTEYGHTDFAQRACF